MRIKIGLAALLLVASLALPSGAAHAQMSYALEGRLGVTFPAGDLSDADAEAGLAAGVEFMLNFHPRATAYVGLNRHAFSCDDDCDLGSGLRSSGVAGGLKFILHNPGDALWWARGGLIGHKLSSDDGSSDRKLGFEVGSGIDMPITHRFYIVPHLSVLSHSTETDFTATYFVFGVGGHFHLN